MKTKIRKNVFIILSILMTCVFLSACYDGSHQNQFVNQNEYIKVSYSIIAVNWEDLEKEITGGYSNTNGKYGTFEGEGYIFTTDNSSVYQLVKIGKDAPTVTVKTTVGYKFVKWTDTGSTNPTRTDLNVQDDVSAHAIVIKEDLWIRYTSGFGGYLVGELGQQVIPYGSAGSPAVAIPNKDFRFVQWSDGVLSPSRENIKLYNNGEIEAQFERYQRVMKLNYNEATGNNEQQEVVLDLDKYLTNSMPNLPVPKREGFIFEGWYSDWHQTIQITDENGKIIADKRWFNNFREWFDNEKLYRDSENNLYDNPEGNLYAKWKSLKPVPTYKVLLIFVTEIDAALKDHYYQDVVVKYKMTEPEKKICELYGELVEGYLNAILNGTVNFEVDTYYTTQKFTEESMNRGTTGLGTSNNIYADYLISDSYLINESEVAEFLDDYGSVLTSFCMNDWEHKLHVIAGAAGAKYGYIHLETKFRAFFNHYEKYFDLEGDVYKLWSNDMETYLHEFIHTVELQIEGTYGLHQAGGYYSEIHPEHSQYEIINDYLRGRFKVEDEYVGIPYYFWTTHNFG